MTIFLPLLFRPNGRGAKGLGNGIWSSKGSVRFRRTISLQGGGLFVYAPTIVAMERRIGLTRLDTEISDVCVVSSILAASLHPFGIIRGSISRGHPREVFFFSMYLVVFCLGGCVGIPPFLGTSGCIYLLDAVCNRNCFRGERTSRSRYLCSACRGIATFRARVPSPETKCVHFRYVWPLRGGGVLKVVTKRVP